MCRLCYEWVGSRRLPTAANGTNSFSIHKLPLQYVHSEGEETGVGIVGGPWIDLINPGVGNLLMFQWFNNDK